MVILTYSAGVDPQQAIAAGAQAVLTVAVQLQPHVVLMDLSMPLMDGITATKIICHKYPHIRIVILTSSYGDDRRQEALEAGASKYLRKGVSVEEISDALRAVAQ